MTTDNDINDEDTEITWINQLTDDESSILNSPIDLNIANMTTKSLKPLIWCNYEITPKKLKLTNTGKTVVLSATWQQESPFIAGGPFLSRHIFSQIHFHWGPTDMEGSQHTIDGESLPMELHAVHFKSDYESPEVAMRHSDGIAILVYFFKLQSMENPKMNGIVTTLPVIKEAQTSSRIVPWPVTNLLRCFIDDYFLYRGSMTTANYRHSVTWLISRESIGISMQQVAEFRVLQDVNSKPVGQKNPRILYEANNRNVYHVNPSGSMYASLLPISRSLSPAKMNTCAKDLEENAKNAETISEDDVKT